jgi:hypothetical protein
MRKSNVNNNLKNIMKKNHFFRLNDKRLVLKVLLKLTIDFDFMTEIKGIWKNYNKLL